MNTTPRQRVMAVLRGEMPEKIPFTVYSTKLPSCTVERELRNRGICPVYRTLSFDVKYPNVKVSSYSYTDDNSRKLVKTIFQTPVGELSTLHEPAGFTSWSHEHMFKTPDDYKALLFMIKDAVITPAYDRAAKLQNDLGEDYLVRDALLSEPLQSLMSNNYMKTEDFCIEWMDNRDELLKLFDAFVANARQIYPIVANGPLEFCNYGGNVMPNIIGKKLFEEYYIPFYNEAAEVLHKKGKLIGTHLDGDNTIIMDLVGKTNLDYIEAYDPGMSPSVAEARKAWPDKVLWINWPSAWHLHPIEDVYNETKQLINEAAPGDKFIIGITEDVPEERWRGNFTAIMDAIDDSNEI